jgi:hypothetical protein
VATWVIYINLIMQKLLVPTSATNPRQISGKFPKEYCPSENSHNHQIQKPARATWLKPVCRSPYGDDYEH